MDDEVKIDYFAVSLPDFLKAAKDYARKGLALDKCHQGLATNVKQEA